MTTTHKISPITVASITTTAAFYVNLSDHLTTPLWIRQNTLKPLHRTAVNIQGSMTTTVHRILPNKNIHIVLFKTT